VTEVDTELKEMLQGRADAVQVQTELPRAVRRRARRRRALKAGAGALTAAAVVAGAFVGIHAAVDHRATPLTTPSPTTPATGGTAVSPSPFLGIWPEADAQALEAAQAAVDQGGESRRLDPVDVALQFVRSVMGWDQTDIEIPLERAGSTDTHDIVALWNRAITARAGVAPRDTAFATTITLDQLGRTGPGGIWSVTGVESGLIDLQCPSPRQDVLVVGISQRVCGTVDWLPRGGAVDAALISASADSRLEPGEVDPWVLELPLSAGPEPRFSGILPPTVVGRRAFLVVRVVTVPRTSGVITPGSVTQAMTVRTYEVEHRHQG
jgi:hypothetical protein